MIIHLFKLSTITGGIWKPRFLQRRLQSPFSLCLFSSKWSFPDLFLSFFAFSNIKNAHDWIRTIDLWCGKQLLYQLCHNCVIPIFRYASSVRKTAVNLHCSCFLILQNLSLSVFLVKSFYLFP